MFSLTEIPFASGHGKVPLWLAVTPSTRTSDMDRSDAPVFLMVISMYGTVVPVPGVGHE
jgi:hypothetical protein